MIIRAAVKSDAKTLWALAVEVYSEAFGNSLSAVDLAAELPTNASEACFACAIDEDTILVAEMDGRLVGYVQFGAVSLPWSQHPRRIANCAGYMSVPAISAVALHTS